MNVMIRKKIVVLDVKNVLALDVKNVEWALI